MRSRKLICWLRGHYWHFYNGRVDVEGSRLYYCCGRCGKRA